MAKGFGIAALVFAILAIFVPVVSIYVVAFAMLMAAVAGFFGDKVFTVASVAISVVNCYFLSPALKTMMEGGGAIIWEVPLILAVPVVALVIGSMRQKKTA